MRPIDEQMSETMAEAGISFLASQIILALFIWKFSNPRPGEKVKNFPAAPRPWCGLLSCLWERKFWRWASSA